MNDTIDINIWCDECDKSFDISIDTVEDIKKIEKGLGMFAFSLDHGDHTLTVWLDKSFKIRSNEITYIIDGSEKIVEKPMTFTDKCIIYTSTNYKNALNNQHSIHKSINNTFGALGIKILKEIDNNKTVREIASLLNVIVDKVMRIIHWYLDEKIITIDGDDECIIDESEQRNVTIQSGKNTIIEFPLFGGNINKVKKEHRNILALCNGNRTIHQISEELDVVYFDVLKVIVKYRGKTLRMVTTLSKE